MALVLFSALACEDDDTTNPPTTNDPQMITEVAQAEARFSILVDALARTNLVTVLSDENAELTVFAPSNTAFQNAFQALGVADLDELEATIGNEALTNILLYHVLGAEVQSSAVTTGYVASSATNADGDNLSIYINTSTGVRINDNSDVVMADIEASNGVVHEIDAVLLPQSIYDLLSANPDFSSLVTALQVADGDLDALFADDASGPFTLFAPDDEAFADLLSALQVADLNELVNAIGGTDALAQILTYHAVSGNITSDEVPAGDVATIEGTTINLATSVGVSITDGAGQVRQVTQADIQGTNGVIHRIDGVLLIQ